MIIQTKNLILILRLISLFLVCEPSKYNNTIYKWLISPDKANIIDIPEWIYEIIVKHKEHKAPQKIKEIENQTPATKHGF